jgi:hypothetical protein
MNDLEFPFAEMSFKRTTPPTVVLNDTYRPRQTTSTVNPPKPKLPPLFIRTTQTPEKLIQTKDPNFIQKF